MLLWRELEIHGARGYTMKKGLLVCAAVLVLAVLVAAPVSAATKHQVRHQGRGVLVQRQAGATTTGTETSLTQPTFGGFVIFQLSPTLAIQPEVNYLVDGRNVGYHGRNATSPRSSPIFHIPVLLAGPAHEGRQVRPDRVRRTGGGLPPERHGRGRRRQGVLQIHGLRRWTSALGRGDRPRQDEGPDRLSLLHGPDQLFQPSRTWS
ncbi:MAG: hypothetical protein MZU84_09530 [Sphingobacterium sp.]|nr:hypothetical protein [Sphingobacterium sp.]